MSVTDDIEPARRSGVHYAISLGLGMKVPNELAA
jgi:hypothetical protein